MSKRIVVSKIVSPKPNWHYIREPWAVWPDYPYLAAHNDTNKWAYKPRGNHVYVYDLQGGVAIYTAASEGQARLFILAMIDSPNIGRAILQARSIGTCDCSSCAVKMFAKDQSGYYQPISLVKAKSAKSGKKQSKCKGCGVRVSTAAAYIPPGATVACGIAGSRCKLCGKPMKHGQVVALNSQGYHHFKCFAGNAPTQILLEARTKFEAPRNKRRDQGKYLASDEIDAYDQWGLPVLHLPKEAADFYLLEYLSSVQGHKEAKGLLLERVNKLSEAFSLYLNMACGGEVRHWPAHTRSYSLKRRLEGWYPGKDSSGNIGSVTSKPPPRTQAWAYWYEIWKKHGLDALHICYDIFEGMRDEAGTKRIFWPSGYGGRAWANITKVLIRYLAGKMPRKVFVDTVWALQHNGGTVLDKAPGRFNYCSSLGEVLDAQRVGSVPRLMQWASLSVRDIFHRLETRG